MSSTYTGANHPRRAEMRDDGTLPYIVSYPTRGADQERLVWITPMKAHRLRSRRRTTVRPEATLTNQEGTK